METFIKLYRRNLLSLIEGSPDNYKWANSPGNVDDFIEKMKIQLPKKNYINSSKAIVMTCKELGIKNTYGAIQKFIDNNI